MSSRGLGHLSTNQRKKAIKAQEKEKEGAAQRGQARFDNYNGNYDKMTRADLKQNIHGFGEIKSSPQLNNNAKFYVTTTTGWTMVYDLSQTYFRLMNPQGEYTDGDGNTKPGTMLPGDFMSISHFKTK